MLGWFAHFLSILRVVLVVIASWLLLGNAYALTFGLLLAALVTDWLDGPLARRAGGTRLGKVLDPLGDSVLAFIPQIVLVNVGREPLWLLLLYIGLAILLALVRLMFIRRGKKQGANRVRLLQVLGLLIAHIGILAYIGMRVHPAMWLVVALFYISAGFAKRKRVQYFLSFLSQ